MSIFIDLILVAVIALCVYMSSRQGFVKVFVEVAGFVLAIIVTFTISTPLAELTYDKIIAPPIVKAVGDALEDTSGNINESVIDALPEFVKDNAEKLGISLEEFNEAVAENISSGTDDAAEIATNDIVEPVISKIIALVYSIVIMIVLLIVVKILARVINKMFSFSIVGKLNRILGGVIGVPKGIIFAILLCLVISLVVSINGGFLFFTNENIENTILFNFFTELV